MIDSALHYGMTRYLLRRVQSEDLVTIFGDSQGSSVSIGVEMIPMRSGELPVATFKFDENRWCFLTTRSVYYNNDGHLLRFEAAAITHVTMNIVPKITKLSTLDEIKLSFSNSADVILLAKAGAPINLLYATIVRLVRGNRKDASQDVDLSDASHASVDETQPPDWSKALFRA